MHKYKNAADSALLGIINTSLCVQFCHENQNSILSF